MNYELAKELKEAGFPRKLGIGGIESIFVPPTLSELIDACGTLLDTLYQTNGRWSCIGYIQRNNESIRIDIDGIEEDCISPEIAVARLWLMLNKK